MFSEIVDIKKINPEAAEYLLVHKQRYHYLYSIIKNLRSGIKKEHILTLDIGPSLFTKLLERTFPDDTILSLGLEHEESRGGHLPSEVVLDKDHYFYFNLNDTQSPDKWLYLPSCDIIIMAEVLEHLHTAPTLVLKFLNSCLLPGGYLVIQTPNAAALKNRVSMLLGRNPFHMIRENADNPGHFREYTLNELLMIAQKTGFTVIEKSIRSYFTPLNSVERIYVSVTNLMPQKFKDGITIVLKKEKDAA
jgi:trans-aconitate methyltransferase